MDGYIFIKFVVKSGESQLEETKHEIYRLGFKWPAKYTAQNDLVDLYHSVYHLQLQNRTPALREKCPNTALFLVRISRIWTEFGEIRQEKCPNTVLFLVHIFLHSD